MFGGDPPDPLDDCHPNALKMLLICDSLKEIRLKRFGKLRLEIRAILK